MFGTGITVTILFLCVHHAHQYQLADEEKQNTCMETSNHRKKFDILVLTQSWPVTVCKEWINNLNGTECAYPKDKNRWTLHGIWPRKLNGGYTEFCNNDWLFDPKQIESIEGELEQAWTQNRKGNPRYAFWGHEWLKHGTCSAVLKPFNSQFNYFNNGIKWNKKYSLSKMFSAAKLLPSDTKTYTPEQFIDAVKAKTKKNPMIGCNEKKYLHEVRICFDKKLKVIDCVQAGDPITCPPSKPIIFPATA